MRNSLLDYALHVAKWPDQRFGDEAQPRSAAVSCLLIGTGAGGIAVRDSVEAIARAAIAANARLVDTEMNSQVVIDRLEFVEIYEDIAITAAQALRDVVCNRSLSQKLSWPDMAIASGQGGRFRLTGTRPPSGGIALKSSKTRARTRRCASCLPPTRPAPKKHWPPGSCRWLKNSSGWPARTPIATPKPPRRCSNCCYR
jgi:hypothetical protein